ncbi:MAG: PilZ domain-containing protein [Candidatus Sulfotelmatobacter sp.]|jgi:hypothetical protein
MGRRSQPRKTAEVQTRIFGTDRDGKIFSANVFTANISRKGAKLHGVHPTLGLADTIGLTYGNNRGHFRVKWIGESARSSAGCVGLVNIAPEKPLWDFPLPADAIDDYEPMIADGRRNPRYRCQNSIEVHLQGGASFWGTVADLSLGGCYVEIPIPLELGNRLRVGIWLGQTKVWAEAQVTHSTPGLGIGMKFTEISELHLDQIRQFLQSLTPLAKKPVRSV